MWPVHDQNKPRIRAEPKIKAIGSELGKLGLQYRCLGTESRELGKTAGRQVTHLFCMCCLCLKTLFSVQGTLDYVKVTINPN